MTVLNRGFTRDGGFGAVVQLVYPPAKSTASNLPRAACRGQHRISRSDRTFGRKTAESSRRRSMSATGINRAGPAGARAGLSAMSAALRPRGTSPLFPAPGGNAPAPAERSLQRRIACQRRVPLHVRCLTGVATTTTTRCSASARTPTKGSCEGRGGSWRRAGIPTGLDLPPRGLSSDSRPRTRCSRTRPPGPRTTGAALLRMAPMLRLRPRRPGRRRPPGPRRLRRQPSC